MTNFTDWLISADEDDKREASDWVHHYPVETDVTELLWDEDARDWVDGPARREVECGCSPGFGHEYGSEGHGA